MQTLIDAFNPQAALGVMCRNQLSVDWRGDLYDCDFNQALELPLAGRARTLWDIERWTRSNTNASPSAAIATAARPAPAAPAAAP